MENEEDTYHFSAEDIGCKVLCMVSYQESPEIINEEWLSFGPIELPPHVKQEVEDNIVSQNCKYPGLIYVNKDDKNKGRGIRVNTRDSIIKETKLKNSLEVFHGNLFFFYQTIQSYIKLRTNMLQDYKERLWNNCKRSSI